MILTKDNKFSLKPGDVLRFPDEPDADYTVLTLIPRFYPNTLSLSIRINKTGQTIYCARSSDFYGAEIIRKEGN